MRAAPSPRRTRCSRSARRACCLLFAPACLLLSGTGAALAEEQPGRAADSAVAAVSEAAAVSAANPEATPAAPTDDKTTHTAVADVVDVAPTDDKTTHTDAVADVAEPGAATPAAPREGGPVKIESELLDITSTQRGRELRFRGKVNIQQQGLQLTSAEADALYPPGEQEPTEIRARGDVTVVEASITARCEEVFFERARQRLVCSGAPARVEGNCERLQGASITMAFAEHRLMVQGGAVLERRACTKAAGP